jgi:hypothetical protein
MGKTEGGLPEGPRRGRIGLAVSWSDADKAYALIDNLNKKDKLTAEVHRTLDGGRSWSRTHEEELLIFRGIGWYFAGCYVNPKDDEEVFALGVCLAHSTEGGRIFKLVGGDGCYTARNYVFKSLIGATTGGRNTREGDLCDEPAAHPGSL